MTELKSSAPAVGDFVQIPLSDGRFAFGRVLRAPLMAFYDLQTSMPVEASEVEKHKIIFKIWVMNKAINGGRWKVFDNHKLDAKLLVEPKFFKQDPISKEFFIHGSTSPDIPTSLEECRDLERAAVWSAEHVEDRLQNHFDGVPCKWVRPATL